MSTKGVQNTIPVVATLLSALFVGGARDADGADHRESPAFAGPFLLSAEDAAFVDEALDFLRVEPVDLPPRQTREHILLARLSRDDDSGGSVQYYVLNQSQGRMLLLLLTELASGDREIFWADGFFIRFPARSRF